MIRDENAFSVTVNNKLRHWIVVLSVFSAVLITIGCTDLYVSTIATPANAQSSGQALPLTQEFDNDDCGAADGWQVVSVDSDSANTWSCSVQFSNANVNGFGDDVAADEWLISPALDMDAQSGETLSFENWTNFTDANYPQLVVRYSTDYDGAGDPTSTVWNALGGITFSPEDSETWTDSGAIDLSSIEGTNVYFAFHYTSSGTEGGSAANWRIDTVAFSGDPLETPTVMPNETATPLPNETPTAMESPTTVDPPVSATAPIDMAQSFPLSQSFDDGVCGATEGWQVVSVDTDTANSWSCSAEFGNADVNGFGDDVAADEWLISPALDMDAQTDEMLAFRSWTNFTDDDYPQLEVLYATDYDGSDPSVATWTMIEGITFAPEDSEEWTDSGAIDLAAISGANVHFAFHYRSTGTTGGSAANWRIDDVSFAIAAAVTPMPTVVVTTTATITATVVSTVTAITTPAPETDAVKIHAIQGVSTTATLDGEVVSVEAIVVGDFQAENQLEGFYLQEEDADADDDVNTSEGLFVYCETCPTDVAVGDAVRVTGLVGENFGMSQIRATAADDIEVLSSDNALPSSATVSLTSNSGSTEAEETFEAVEGMLVTFSDTLVVSEYFELARFGQLVLTADERPRQFTDQAEPDVDGYTAYLAALSTKRIILDDDSSKQNVPTSGDVDTPYFWPRGTGDLKGLSTTNFVRGGDTITDAGGVLEWAFGAWRIRPVDEAFTYDFVRENPRESEAPLCGTAEIKIASFNVLNFFTTLGERGANSTAELERQREKIAAAICSLDADLFGLIEIENNGNVALDDLLNGTNGVNTQCSGYNFVDVGVIGTDAIAVAFIYKDATVTPVGSPAILDSSVDARFVDTKNRPALAHTFKDTNGDRFTAVVNHLKSKGSDCDELSDPDLNDGAANCNLTRTDAAAAMVDWLATDPTGSEDPDFLVMGDLNAYRNETPIDAIKAGADDILGTADDYIDLLATFEGTDAYSYIFDGQRGYLDYMMATRPFSIQVRKTEAWHINADEISLFDYNDGVLDAGERDFNRESDALPIYESTAFRASDHDPLMACLDLDYAPSVFVNLPVMLVQE